MSVRSNNPRSLLHDQRGAALAEVLIAILILISGAVASLSLMDSILRLAVSSNNRILAVNLAREGVEAMRSVRDSNWLLYSGSQRDATSDTRDHWNDGFDVATGDDTARYRVYLTRDANFNLRWMIDSYSDIPASRQSDDPADIMADDFYRIYLDPNIIDPLDVEPPTVYNYSYLDILPQPDLDITATPFYRQIKVTYLESYDSTPNDVDVNDNMVQVESNVYWMEGGRVQSVALVTMLSDWYGRSDHTI